MGSGRDRLDIGNRSLARRNTYITRQEWKRRHAGNPDRHGAEDDDLSLVSDPNSLYLGPLISVFSHNTETRAIPSPSETEEDAMQRFVSINTAVQSYAEERPTEQPTDIERAAAESPRAHQLSGKGYGVEKASPSRLTSVPLDDDSWSPFQIWLLTQTQGTGMSPSGENNANDILESNTTAINDTHDKMRPKKEDVPDPGRLQTSMDLSHSESQVFEERYPLSEASISSSKTRPYVADRVAHSSGAKYSRHDKGSSYSSGQITNSHANSPGRRDIHVSLSCRGEDERVYRCSDQSSYKTAMDMMSAPSRGMSDSSYYETQAGSGYEGTFPGQSIPETSPRISTSDSRGAPDTSLLQGSLETSSNYHSFKKHVRSRFREELGEVMPDQSPRFRIVSKLRGLSRHGRHSTRGKDASEVTNHIFLSEYVPKDVEARRKLVYHGCPQAAESAPEGWQQSLRRKELSASGSYPGETQSVHEPKLSANEPWFVYPTARPELDVAVESSSELALRPLRTIHARSRAGDGPLVMSECPSQGTGRPMVLPSIILEWREESPLRLSGSNAWETQSQGTMNA
ncbi:hypothetical protein VUR80DRAFT_8716 [Thermomyces stellatus]